MSPMSSTNVENMNLIVDFMLKNQLPAMCGTRDWVEAGCLLSYWTDHRELKRRAAFYVDKILKGVKPGDLPVERPSKFDMRINLKTAKALGITIPPTLLYQATEVIR